MESFHPGAEINHSKPKTLLHSGELARLAGVSTDTLRYYERKGLLPRPLRLQNGYRQYSPEIVDRLRVIRGALTVGFTIEELAEIFRMRDRGGMPCGRVRDLAKTKLAEMEKRLQEIRQIRNELSVLLKEWNIRLSKIQPGEKAHLLESLPISIRRTRLSPLSPLALARKKKRP